MNNYKEPCENPKIYNDTTDPSFEGLNFQPLLAYTSIIKLMRELTNVRKEIAEKLTQLNLNDYEIENKLEFYPHFVLQILGINLERITIDTVKIFTDMSRPPELIDRLLKRYVVFFNYIITCSDSSNLSAELFEEMLKFSFYAPHLITPLIQALELRRQLLIKIGK